MRPLLNSRRSWAVPQACRQTTSKGLAQALKKCKTATGRLILLQQLAKQQQANSRHTGGKRVAQDQQQQHDVQVIQKALKQLAPEVKRLPVGSVEVMEQASC